MLLTTPELRKPFVCTAMNYLEVSSSLPTKVSAKPPTPQSPPHRPLRPLPQVFMIGCEAVMSIADDFPESKALIRKRQFFMSLRRTIVLLAKSEMGLPAEALLAESLNGGRGGGGGSDGSGSGGGVAYRARGTGEGSIFMSSLASSRKSRKTATISAGATPQRQPLPEAMAVESSDAASSGVTIAGPAPAAGGETSRLPPLAVQGARCPKGEGAPRR